MAELFKVNIHSIEGKTARLTMTQVHPQGTDLNFRIEDDGRIATEHTEPKWGFLYHEVKRLLARTLAQATKGNAITQAFPGEVLFFTPGLEVDWISGITVLEDESLYIPDLLQKTQDERLALCAEYNLEESRLADYPDDRAFYENYRQKVTVAVTVTDDAYLAHLQPEACYYTSAFCGE